MTTFICVFEPTTEARTNNGAVPLTIALNAANAKIAAATAMIKLSEVFPDSMDNFNVDEPIICEDAVGSPRPALEQFDEKFAVENEFDGEKWQPVKYKEFKKLATKPRIAALLMFGKTQITDKQYTFTLKYLNESTEDPKVRNIATGLAEITKVSLMDAEATMEIAQAVYEHADDNVTIEDAKALGESWLTEEPELPPVEDEPVLKRDYAALDLEIALALLDIKPSDAKSADIRKAKELISTEDKPWKRLSMDLRTFPSVLDIPRENIFTLVTEAREKPELFDDANARKAFIDSKLGTNSPKITSLGSGRFAVDNLDTKPANDETTKEDIEPAKSEKPKRSSKKKDSPAKTEKESVKEVIVETEQAQTPVVNQHIEPAVEVVNVQQDDFQHRASVLDEVLNKGDSDNLSIWKRVQRTDARFTKPLEGMGFVGTSINSTYMFMRATEIFGPIGEGWGYEVIEEKLIDGKPLVEPVLDERNKQVATRFLRDGDGSLFCEQNHSIKIRFWYIIECETRGEFESYGATPYRYQTQYGMKVDGEAIKKSLTDAIKKALSMLGFSSDVFMGMHDNPEYVASNKLEYEIKAASDNAEDATRIRKELDEKLTRHTETMRSAVTPNELRGITSTLTREISTHAKLAKQRGDSEYEKYLNGRLRRLNEIEKECLDQLNHKEEAI
ncbi:hypothetical protein AB7250_07585 [Providencia stuartii]|uniref:hypothetical protein n=1 Tax=Providencia TaxID=586 RepID=UPI0013A79A7F|nr:MULTISPECIES: hypothetical protein [Providencia]MBQ0456023.1 hypothetical protein [Providencia stuartii]MDN7224050.1 hypothetical protein [Providencia stuartii]QIB29840.1 hypothetical protein G3A48_08875 [Providencia stuartii]QPN42147.1 hypothetical protein I3B46_08650 [Providencia sp. 2.29]WAZ77144.1 hypothetical protein O4001_12835 [Providencia stuartii]